jgi:hypothetical protein
MKTLSLIESASCIGNGIHCYYVYNWQITVLDCVSRLAVVALQRPLRWKATSETNSWYSLRRMRLRLY